MVSKIINKKFASSSDYNENVAKQIQNIQRLRY